MNDISKTSQKRGIMKEYKRIRDKLPDPEFDSLEKMCNIEAKQGWEVLSITDGDQFRCATLVREVPESREPHYSPTNLPPNFPKPPDVIDEQEQLIVSKILSGKKKIQKEIEQKKGETK